MFVYLKRFKKWIIGLIIPTAFAAGGVAITDAEINPYTDKGTFQELPLVSDIPQKERVEIAKDEARATVKGWNDEFAISIRPQFHGVASTTKIAGNRPLLSKRMEYVSGNATAFIEPKSENEFDIDYLLTSKPSSSVFEYIIEGADAFDFVYQAPLWQDEGLPAPTATCTDTDCDTDGDGNMDAHRPENVVGSFAVFHKWKQNHLLGHTNYATGKVGHIYRPQLTDGKGRTFWGEMTYDDVNNILRVKIPDSVYGDVSVDWSNFIVDPTFGYTSSGATGNSSTENWITGSVFVGRAGTATKITASLIEGSTDNAHLARAGVYLHSDLSYFATTDERNGFLFTGGKAWYDFTFSSPPTFTATDYILTIWAGAGVQSLYVYYDTGDTNQGHKDPATYDTYPDPLVPTHDNNRYSIYATFTAFSRTVDTSSFGYCRTLTATSGGGSGGMATTTTGLFPLHASTTDSGTQSSLIATSSGGNVQVLDANNELPIDVVFVDESTCSFSASATAIPHYWEKFASTTGIGDVWLGTENISSTSDKVLAMYYGDSTFTTNLNSPGQVFATSSPLVPVSAWDLGVPGTATTTYPDFTDSTYNANHGSSQDMANANLISGYLDGALDFDGSTNWIDIGDASSLQITGDLTISAWLYQDTNGSLMVFSSFNGPSTSETEANNYLYFIGIEPSSSPDEYYYLHEYSTGSNELHEIDAVGNINWPTGEWAYFTLVRDGTTLDVYKNGVLDGSATFTNAPTGGTTGVGKLGASTGNSLTADVNNFDGKIDDMRYYSNALHAMDVLTIYNNTSDSATFWTWGSEQTPSVATSVFQELLYIFE